MTRPVYLHWIKKMLRRFWGGRYGQLGMETRQHLADGDELEALRPQAVNDSGQRGGCGGRVLMQQDNRAGGGAV